MIKLFKILFYLYIFFVIIIVTGCFNGFLSFGHGLGDLYYLIFSVGVLITTVVIFFQKKSIVNQNKLANSFGIFLILITLIILILKLTVLRGPD
jgi:hypothetical protein